MTNTTKVLSTLSAVFAVLFVPPLFFDSGYVESFGDTAFRSFCAIFITIVAWAVIGKIRESDKNKYVNKNRRINRDGCLSKSLVVIVVLFGLCFFCSSMLILSLEGFSL